MLSASPLLHLHCLRTGAEAVPRPLSSGWETISLKTRNRPTDRGLRKERPGEAVLTMCQCDVWFVRGSLSVIPGSPAGLEGEGTTTWSQERETIEGDAAQEDFFGLGLAILPAVTLQTPLPLPHGPVVATD